MSFLPKRLRPFNAPAKPDSRNLHNRNVDQDIIGNERKIDPTVRYGLITGQPHKETPEPPARKPKDPWETHRDARQHAYYENFRQAPNRNPKHADNQQLRVNSRKVSDASDYRTARERTNWNPNQNLAPWGKPEPDATYSRHRAEEPNVHHPRTTEKPSGAPILIHEHEKTLKSDTIEIVHRLPAPTERERNTGEPHTSNVELKNVACPRLEIIHRIIPTIETEAGHFQDVDARGGNTSHTLHLSSGTGDKDQSLKLEIIHRVILPQGKDHWENSRSDISNSSTPANSRSDRTRKGMEELLYHEGSDKYLTMLTELAEELKKSTEIASSKTCQLNELKGKYLSIIVSLATQDKLSIPTEVSEYFQRAHSLSKSMPLWKKVRRIVLIGETGTGKSAFGNMLLGRNDGNPEFQVGSSVDVCTKNMQEATGHWLGKSSNEQITVIDFPGFGNVKQDLEGDLPSWIQQYSTLRYVTTFVLVFNGCNARFSEGHTDMIKICKACFGVDFFQNLVIVFSKWFMDEYSKVIREKEGNTKEKKMTHYNNILNQELNADRRRSFDFFFVDSLAGSYSAGGTGSLNDELQRFRKVVTDMIPCPVTQIEGREQLLENYKSGMKELLDSAKRKEKGRKETRELRELRHHLKRLTVNTQKAARTDRHKKSLLAQSLTYQEAEQLAFTENIR